MEDKYDLIIIDEDNSNFDLLDFLNYCEEKKLKKIVISSKKIDEDDYLEKQFIKSELLGKIMKYLGRQNGKI